MYPTNQYMDPYYSHYRNHTPYPYYPPPGWEAGHPQAMDSSYRPPSYGSWPYSAGMHHPHPSEVHCCYTHTYPPGYHSFRPPFPQELPPPHLYYHGPFPQHPNGYPFSPHPHPADQTPYGYDKFKTHCCGCQNHVCQGGEKSNVKIEEEKPGSEQKDSDSGSLIRHPNHQYPFLWLPSGNMEGKENGRRYGLPPQFLSGWDPVGSKRTGDVKKQEQDDQKEKQFQWPIVWMPPGYDEPKQKTKDLKEMDKSPKFSEEAPPSPKIKIIPLSWFENGHHDQKPAAQDVFGDHSERSEKSQPATAEHQDDTAVEGHHKTTPVVPRRVNDERKPTREIYKTIPVVLEKDIGEKKVGTCRTIPVMSQKESDEKKPAAIEKKEVKEASSAERGGGNGKTNCGESARAKHSKLPPVCLRVDPLPKKKSGNGSSRSPSPPARKDADKNKVAKEAQNQNLEAKQSDTKKEITMFNAKEKSQEEMKKGIGIGDETVQAASVKRLKEKEVTTSEDKQKVQAGRVKSVTQESAGANILDGGDKSTQEDEINNQGEAAKVDARTCITNLSEADAAVRVQSAYRGYDVRRWQPLDKLRKIRDVREQMQGVRKQLQSLEASSRKPSEKEQVAIGETIMNLLLKLDTIQGLHPSVRGARKSVARELVCLQEKLDTLCKHPSGEEEKPETAESVIQTADPISSAEASVKEKARRLDGAEPSSRESMELCSAAQSDVPRELKQVADPSGQKHHIEESSAKAPEEGKAAAQVECPGASLMDIMSHAALSGHSTDEKHQIEESNDVSKEVVPKEDNVASQSEGLEVPSVDSLEQLHEAASSGDSSELKQSTTSSEQNVHTEELNQWVPLVATGDNSATTATASVEDGEATDKDGPIEGQVQEAAAVETSELRHEVSLAKDQHKKSSAPVDCNAGGGALQFTFQVQEAAAVEASELRHEVSLAKDQHKESSAPVDCNAGGGALQFTLEDSSVSLKDAESHEHDSTPTTDSVMSNVDDQPKEARDINMRTDAMQDSTKEPDGIPGASMDDSEFVASAESEKPVQVSLLEPASESDSAPDQTVLEESDNAVQSEVSGKDDSHHVDQRGDPTVDRLKGGSPTVEDPSLEALRKEPDLQRSHSSLVQEADDTRVEILVPELDSCGLSCPHEGAVTGYEMPEERASSGIQTDVQEDGFCEDSVRADAGVSQTTDECNEMLKEIPVCGTRAYSTEADVQVPETDKCSEKSQDAPLRATGASYAEEEANIPKDDVAVQTENKAPEEAISASAAPDVLKDSDEKNLADENQKLKEMLQKLLASGKDQMGIIEDLSEKVKVLERKLARKKKPKVRLHKPKV